MLKYYKVLIDTSFLRVKYGKKRTETPYNKFSIVSEETVDYRYKFLEITYKKEYLLITYYSIL